MPLLGGTTMPWHDGFLEPLVLLLVTQGCHHGQEHRPLLCPGLWLYSTGSLETT